jgi:hypothetical protein
MLQGDIVTAAWDSPHILMVISSLGQRRNMQKELRAKAAMGAAADTRLEQWPACCLSHLLSVYSPRPS